MSYRGLNAKTAKAAKSLGLKWMFTSKFALIKAIEKYKSNFFTNAQISFHFNLSYFVFLGALFRVSWFSIRY